MNLAGGVALSFGLNYILFESLWTLETEKKLVYASKSRQVSNIHCVVAISSVLAFLWCAPMEDISITELATSNYTGFYGDWIRFTMYFSLGYFLHDLIRILQNEPEDLPIIFHHVIMCICIFCAQFMGYYGNLQFMCLLEESSTPFLNMRYFERKDRNSHRYKVAEGLFAVFFFLSRLIVGNFWAYVVYTISVPWSFRNLGGIYFLHMIVQVTLFTGSRLLNLFWFWKIVAMVVRHNTKNLKFTTKKPNTCKSAE
mmetsp:Transcript_23369/g.65632  ORF Transcript_23369/g.65632 Transcript_23369/m.65632 type:complete len:255 (+) Transcript_23369:164-928(+)